MLLFALLLGCGPAAVEQPETMRPVAQESKDPTTQTDEPLQPTLKQKNEKLQLAWMEPPTVFGKVVFDDELAPVAQAIASRLPPVIAGELEIVPPSELRKIQRTIREGRLPGQEGACPSPPPPLVLFEFLHSGDGLVETRINCKDSIENSCVLTVEWMSPKKENKKGRMVRSELARYELVLNRDAGIKEWVEAILTDSFVRVSPPEPTGGLGILMGREVTGKEKGGYRIDVDGVVQEGPWKQTINSDLFKPQAETLHQCTKKKARATDWWLQPYLIEVSPTGNVTRCEAQYQHRLDPPEFACRCKAISTNRFPRAEGPRRARFTIRTSHSDETNAFFLKKVHRLVEKELTSDDESTLLGSGAIDTKGLGDCTKDIVKAAVVSFSFSARVQRDGTVAGIQTGFSDTVAKNVQKCVSDILWTSQFNCPLSGSATVDGKVTVKIRPRK